MFLRRVARPLLATAFISDGWRAVTHPGDEIAALPQARQALHAVGERVPYVPDNPVLLVRALGVVKIGAGAALSLGLAPRVAASVLAVLHIPTIALTHPFWRSTGVQRREDIAGFVRDGAVLGGLLLAAGDTAGKPSISWRLDNARSEANKRKDAVAKAATIAGAGRRLRLTRPSKPVQIIEDVAGKAAEKAARLAA